MALSDLWPSWKPAWILHEDEDLLVVDKPAGVSTHAPEPDRVDDAHTRLTAFLRERGVKSPYLGIHQRLDRDTSGVLLFTRRKEANRSIAEQFEGRRVQKSYVAGVVGKLDRALRDQGVLHHKLVPSPGSVMRALPADARDGQEAITRYRVLERAGDRALVQLVPETGRTHQIRVQLAAVGAPVAGDVLYGIEPPPGGRISAMRAAPCHRLLLHAAELAITHPGSGQPLTLRAALPALFGAWLRGDATTPLGDVDAVERALRDAAGLRYGVARAPAAAGADGPAHTAFRLANGAGDGLPGVALDVYAEWLALSISSPEAEAAREAILEAAARLGARGVYLKMRPKHASVIVDARREEFSPSEAARGEAALESFTVLENALPYQVRLGEGLSTGIFLDQRENRRRVREMAGGLRVLNLFAYTGAFTVAAIAGGARSSVTVDVAANAIAWARQNLEAVGADPAHHRLVEADAIRWLEEAATRDERFDLALLDPPSFATTKRSTFSAEDHYRKVAALALRVLAPGGRLLACTNHRGIVRAKFRRFLHEAVRDAGREVAQMKDLPDPADFPPDPGFEPHLKSVLVTLAGVTQRTQRTPPTEGTPRPTKPPATSPRARRR